MNSTRAHEQTDEGECDGVKGFQKIMPRTSEEPYKYRYTVMMWEQRDGRWFGRWQWTEWKVEAPDVWMNRSKDHREDAPLAWDATDVPQEILLWTIERIVGSPLSTARATKKASKSWRTLERVAGLGSLALVCRAWYDLVAPALHSKIEVRDEVFDSWSSIRKSIWRSGSKITVRSISPFMASARLSRLAPRPSPALWMEWEGRDWDATSAMIYHPSHAVIYAHMHRSMTSVIRLQLYRCHFLSSSDLLRLLASLSALEGVSLASVIVAHVATFVVRPGRPGQLRRIYVNDGCTPTGLPFLTQHWTWARKPLDHKTSFRGLSPTEQRLVANVSEQMTISTSSTDSRYFLDAMDVNGRTWVACTRTKSSFLQAEFHAFHDDPRRSDAARVQHILLRAQDLRTLREVTEVSSKLGELFAQFADLESIVIETTADVRGADVRPLVEALREVNTATVRHRTCEEAHTIARGVMRGAAYSPHTGLLSPFWCLQEYLPTWDIWLTSEYYERLPAGDWRGWDPSRPLAATVPLAAGGQ